MLAMTAVYVPLVMCAPQVFALLVRRLLLARFASAATCASARNRALPMEPASELLWLATMRTSAPSILATLPVVVCLRKSTATMPIVCINNWLTLTREARCNWNNRECFVCSLH
jgi:hypothetical protein